MRWCSTSISAITFLAAVFFLATRGLHLSIEFTGGTVIEVAYAQAADIDKVRATVEALNFGEVQVQNFGTSRDVLIRLPVRGDVKQSEVVGRVFDALCKAEGGTVASRQVTTDKGEPVSKPVCGAAGTEPVQLQRSEFVGPPVGSELARDGAYALLATVVGIMIYLAFRFEWKFSVAGIVANLHDVVIILGFFAFFQWEFSLVGAGGGAGGAGLLGQRVGGHLRPDPRGLPQVPQDEHARGDRPRDHQHDEPHHHHARQDADDGAVDADLSAAPTLHYFAVALTIGILFGIYSSVFVAAAIAMWLGVKREDLVQPGPGKETDPDDPNAGAVV